MSILVIGESCHDWYVYGSVKRLAPEAPVPVLQPSLERSMGGMAMNVYKNLMSLGSRCDILTNPNWEGIIKRRYIDERTNQMFLRVDIGDQGYGHIDWSNIHWDDYQLIVISDYDKGYLSAEDIGTICQAHPKVMLDTKKILGPWALQSLYIKINHLEYAATRHSITQALEHKLIITLGSEGCEHQGIRYPVPTVDVKDTCGAGDTFIAAMAHWYNKGNAIESCISFANECATQVIQKRGTSVVSRAS